MKDGKWLMPACRPVCRQGRQGREDGKIIFFEFLLLN